MVLIIIFHNPFPYEIFVVLISICITEWSEMGHLSIESYLYDSLMIWTPGNNLFLNTFPCRSMKTVFYLDIFFSICPLCHIYPPVASNLLDQCPSVSCNYTCPIHYSLYNSPFRELATRATSTNRIAASWMLQATWLATVASRHIVWQALLISL